jgi:hypothetical protein
MVASRPPDPNTATVKECFVSIPALPISLVFGTNPACIFQDIKFQDIKLQNHFL